MPMPTAPATASRARADARIRADGRAHRAAGDWLEEAGNEVRPAVSRVGARPAEIIAHGRVAGLERTGQPAGIGSRRLPVGLRTAPYGWAVPPPPASPAASPSDAG